jgi:transposase-like protein
MSVNLTDPIFHNEEAARAHFEALHWPDGKPICPHCGVVGETTLIKGKSHRPGMYQCNACLKPFTVTVGTVMEDSHLPLTKWALAFHLMASSKKGVSAHQLMRTLGIGSYRTAWFMAHRIREAMADPDPEPARRQGQDGRSLRDIHRQARRSFRIRQGLAEKARNGHEAQGSDNG